MQRILIVDDNANSRKIHQDILEMHGYEVLATKSGLQGVQLARTEKPDLILIDIHLAEVSGTEVTRLLKIDPLTLMIPVIALTADAMPERKADFYEAGGNGYLTKPFTAEDLVAEIQRVFTASSVPN